MLIAIIIYYLFIDKKIRKSLSNAIPGSQPQISVS